MSIINEALKKTEEYLQKNAAKGNPEPAPDKPKSYLLYILILIVGLALSNFIFNQLSSKVQKTQPPKKITPAITPTVKAPVFTPLESKKPPEQKTTPATSFILNGIFFSDNAGYALINNQIVRENDYVDRAKVIQITAKMVKLDNGGQTITLTTNR